MTEKCLDFHRNYLQDPQTLKVMNIETVTFNYRPQRSCGKVIFSQVSVILSMGEVSARHPQAYTPLWADPPGRRLLLRTVRILLECILVKCINSIYQMRKSQARDEHFVRVQNLCVKRWMTSLFASQINPYRILDRLCMLCQYGFTVQRHCSVIMSLK